MCSHFIIHFKVRVKEADNVDLLSQPRSLEEVYTDRVAVIPCCPIRSNKLFNRRTGKITGHPVAICPLLEASDDTIHENTIIHGESLE